MGMVFFHFTKKVGSLPAQRKREGGSMPRRVFMKPTKHTRYNSPFKEKEKGKGRKKASIILSKKKKSRSPVAEGKAGGEGKRGKGE